MEFLGLVNYALFMAIFIAIYALLALGLNIQWGFAGLFNAGIAGFFAVGAYTSAILTTEAVDGRIGGFDLHFVIGWIGAMIAAVMTKAGLTTSNGEARRLAQGGGLRLNDEAIADGARLPEQVDYVISCALETLAAMGRS